MLQHYPLISFEIVVDLLNLNNTDFLLTNLEFKEQQ